MRDNLDAAEGKISALEALIGSATPHPALPGAGDLDNWSGGLWKMVAENGSVLVNRGEVPFDAPWSDKVEKVSVVHFRQEDNVWKSLHFMAAEFSSTTSAKNAFAFTKGRVENVECVDLYVVSSDEDLIRFSTLYGDITINDVTFFRRDGALFTVSLTGDNVERWSSAPYAELLKSRIEKST